MALSNSQYDAIMREYGKQQMENQHSQEARKKEIYQKVPAVKELEAEIAERSVACARKLLEGNQEAIYELREKLADLKEQKALLIKAAGYSDDYLELHYRCKDCRDTMREPICNAIGHQDYGMGARIELLEYEDEKLVIQNYGQFIPNKSLKTNPCSN